MMTTTEARAASCATFTPAPGGAWPWCDTCGTRADLHAGTPPTAPALARMVARCWCPDDCRCHRTQPAPCGCRNHKETPR